MRKFEKMARAEDLMKEKGDVERNAEKSVPPELSWFSLVASVTRSTFDGRSLDVNLYRLCLSSDGGLVRPA